jgi:hypothetical protein
MDLGEVRETKAIRGEKMISTPSVQMLFYPNIKSPIRCRN